MTYLPGFKSDVFISYPHRSNWDDWVSDFHSRLESKLREILSKMVVVWRDTQLRSTHVFDEEIKKHLRTSGVFVAIAAPIREDSEWCALELEEFRNATEDKLGFHLLNLCRAVVVAKIPSKNKEHLQIVPKGLCVEFFEGEYLDFRELSKDSEEYNSRISRLAQDIAAVLQEIKRRLTVYLISSCKDARRHWKKLCWELSDRGYVIQPGSWEESLGNEEQLNRCLEESCLSVNVLSGNYNELIERQLELASKLDIPRIVWAPAGTNFQDKQREFLENLRQEPRGADLLDGKSLDDAIYFLLRRLNLPDKFAPSPEHQPKAIIYLACSQEDHPLIVAEENNAARIRDYLYRMGFEVDTPATGKKIPLKRLRADTEKKLAICNGVILYWGQAEHYWVEEMRNLLRKALGKRGAIDFRSKLIYISDPEAKPKTRYQTHEALLVRQFGNFNQDELMPFLEPLE